MVEPGVYRMSWSGLTLAECWRFGGLWRFPIALGLKLCGHRGDWIWLPIPTADSVCTEDQLTEACRGYLATALSDAPLLGYRLIAFCRPVLPMDPSFRDSGGFWALHDDGRRVLSAFYSHVQATTTPPPPATRGVSTFCTFSTPDLHSTTVTDAKVGLDDPGRRRSIRLPGADIATLDRRLQEELSRHSGPVLRMESPQEALEVISRREQGWYERQVARGLYVKVSEEEQAMLLQEAADRRGQTVG